jgi:hypothetical protein
MDIEQAYISLAALDAADTRSAEIAGKRERLLRKLLPCPQFADSFSEALLKLRFLSLVHRGKGIILDDNKSTDFKYLLRPFPTSIWGKFCRNALPDSRNARCCSE